MATKERVIVLSTGGTIEKSYDEYDGSIGNKEPLTYDWIVQKLRLPYTDVVVKTILQKDSLDMTLQDRQLIIQEIKNHLGQDTPIVVTHGTDTMEQTANLCVKEIKAPDVPVVFTGAMKPMKFEDSDARQNFTEALMVAKTIEPGIYISFHNQLFIAGNVRKNKKRGTFEIIE